MHEQTNADDELAKMNQMLSDKVQQPVITLNRAQRRAQMRKRTHAEYTRKRR